MSAQTAEEIDRATGRVVEGLLPVLDACEAAFAHGADEVEPVWSALIGALQKQGLEALDLQDKPFDPTVAEAVAHEPGDGSDVRRAGRRRDVADRLPLEGEGAAAGDGSDAGCDCGLRVGGSCQAESAPLPAFRPASACGSPCHPRRSDRTWRWPSPVDRTGGGE